MDVDSVTIIVRVIPRSSRSEIVGEVEGVIKIKLAAPPVDGGANEELISLLSRQLHVSKSAIEIVSGATARQKKIRIHGISPDAVDAVLQSKS